MGPFTLGVAAKAPPGKAAPAAARIEVPPVTLRKSRRPRRDFLKVTGGTSILAAAGAAFPGGAFAATPKVKGPIKIGYQAVLSGTLAGYGEFHKMGALMAVEELNQKGGIAGEK